MINADNQARTTADPIPTTLPTIPPDVRTKLSQLALHGIGFAAEEE
jgi:hypothetical protein